MNVFFVPFAPFLHKGALNLRRLLRCVRIFFFLPRLEAVLFIFCLKLLILSPQEGLVLISGLPESGWSESDIITLVEPFGIASDLIMAVQLGKVRLLENR